MDSNRQPDAEQVKAAAAERWPVILRALAPELIPALDAGPSRKVRCPLPHHDDKDPSFRIDKPGEGRAICSCGGYDGWNLLELLRRWDFPECLRQVADVLHLDGGNGKPAPGPSQGNGQPDVDPLDRMAAVKRCPVESLRAYGATSFPTQRAVAFPMFDANGAKCSQFDVWPDATDDVHRKGMNQKGKPTGMFLPIENGEPRLPAAGETWLIVEGVKDAAAMHGLGYSACGLPGKTCKAEWVPMFRGLKVLICLDNDQAGREATPKLRRSLEKEAASVGVVELPAAGDVRDAITAAGPEAVKAAVEKASQEGEPTEPWPVEEYDALALVTVEFCYTFLVDEVLVALQPSLGGGTFKSIKTGVHLDLGISAASGTKFLGRFAVPCPVRVGFISSESGMPTIAETCQRIASAKGVDLGALRDSFVVTPDSHDFSSTAGLDALVGWCKRREFVLVIIDPAYLNFAGLADVSASVWAVGAKLRAFSVALLREGITPVVVHHSVKVPLDKYAPLDLAALSGSGWAEFARQWILLNRRAEYVDGSGFHELHCRIGGSAGHSSLWHLDIDEGPAGTTPRNWRIGLTEAGQAKRDAARAKDEAFERDVQDKAGLIVRHLQQRPGQTDTETGIFKLGIGRTKAAIQALQLLQERGQVAFEDDCVRKPGRKSGRPGWRLLVSENSVSENQQQETGNGQQELQFA